MANDTEITCTKCKSSFNLSFDKLYKKPHYCCFCGNLLDLQKENGDTSNLEIAESSSLTSGSATLVPGHHPENDPVQFSIDSFQILKEVGKGGMGEVYLAYDTSCGRRIALKRIREDLSAHTQMHNRFLKEARITSQLTHPSIIPIYSIHGKDQHAYYTMPYVKGSTFKEVLSRLRSADKNGQKSENGSGSIPALVRLFLNVCQAIAYAHSKGVLHRDIKPENIILGQFGEVLILDWGLAKLVGAKKEVVEEEEFSQVYSKNPLHQITRLGKVVGTVSYMAPERAMGCSATVQSDIYSLGVILYQILTLRLPFKRRDLKKFREKMHLEVLYDPIEVAPYRDVPKILSRIVFKCLSTDLDFRYKSVQDLIHDLESYIEGRSEWFQVAQLDILNKSDWEFQENVLIAEHIAITRGPEISDWVSLMISKSSFSDTIMLEANVKLGEKGHGVGFLLGIPEISQRTHLNDGYCLWLGSEVNRSTKLLRSTVEVMHSSDIYLKRHEWYHIKIEKLDNKLHVFINGTLQLSYTSYLPLVGTHVGLLSRDADFAIKDVFVSVGSQSVMVNCLAVPDAFLTKKDFSAALSEYRRIGNSFPGRAEGREAMFRAGITLLEQARANESKEAAAFLHEQALEEFAKLHKTPGAPLEYLGKALIYQSLNDNDEEVKCFEFAFRRYPQHPLLPILHEQILYRMHTSSRSNRLATYRFILLVLRHMQEFTPNPNIKKLFASLKKHWEPLPFIIQNRQFETSPEVDNAFISTVLSFWLAKYYVIAEIIEEIASQPNPDVTSLANAFYSLIEMDAIKTAKKYTEKIYQNPDNSIRQFLKFIDIAILAYSKETLEQATQTLIPLIETNPNHDQEHSVLFLLKQAVRFHYTQQVYEIVAALQNKKCVFTPEAQTLIDCYHIWSLLLDKNWEAVEIVLNTHPYEELLHESSLLYFLYGCWLYVSEGQEIAAVHFSGSIENTHPRSWTLFNQFYNSRINFEAGWIQKAFAWEKRQLYFQLSLFYDCIGDPIQSQYFHELEQKKLINEVL